jgi:hypothetical protein
MTFKRLKIVCADGVLFDTTNWEGFFGIGSHFLLFRFYRGKIWLTSLWISFFWLQFEVRSKLKAGI